MNVTFLFDEEDYITPPEEQLDDLLKMLADVMTEQRVSGSFFVIGERIRCLRDRGRRDVLDAIARHDIGSHVNMGSIHPTLTERMEHADWTNGCARMAADEIAGADEIGEIIGKPLTSFARHGGAFAPQLLAMLGARAMPFVYSPASLPSHNITWYCNTLNFAHSLTVFQEAYHSRATFLEKEKEFLDAAARLKARDWVGVFHSHPCHIKTRTFWDNNYYQGVNTPPAEWVVPPFYPEFNMQTVRENWTFHCARLRDNPDFTIATIGQLAKQYGAQAPAASEKEILALAAQAADSPAPFFTDRFSAAEIADLLARAALHRARHGALPASLPRRNVLGPTQPPLAVPTARRLEPEAVLRIARGLDAAVTLAGALPSVVRCAEGTLGSVGEIGLSSALAALGAFLTAPPPPPPPP
ncbi:MAG TPA: hypothetical protein P5137_16440, partial [Candidatus Brocadiia bacterium]|nr:hypothetical protein [Candidatus Brocadiia bacterium]